MKRIFAFLLVCVMCLPLVSCGEEARKDAQKEKILNELATKTYTQETLLEDLDEYVFSHRNGVPYCNAAYFGGDYQRALASNKSVSKLVDISFVQKLEEKKMDSEDIAVLLEFLKIDYDYSDDCVWNYVPYPTSKYYGKAPLWFCLLEDYKSPHKSEIKEAAAKAIKEILVDPQSFYYNEESDESAYFYVQSKGEDNIEAYIDSNGCYTGRIYFHIVYHAKNGFGGYVKNGIWCYVSPGSGYSGEAIHYHVYTTTHTGTDKYNSGFTLYGTGCNLDCVEIMFWS